MLCGDLMKICVTVPMENISRLDRYFSSTYYFYSLHIWTVFGRQILYLFCAIKGDLFWGLFAIGSFIFNELYFPCYS